MNAFRGARFASNIGRHSLKLCRVQQKRRLVSLACPAMAQSLSKICKPSFQYGIVVPVNKFDLSGTCGILSSTCSAMFSTGPDTLSEETSGDVEDTDSDCKESRWPSPVHQQATDTFKKENSVFAGGYSFDHEDKTLRNLFSQFGEVTGITVPQLNLYNESNSTPEIYRFAFIHFQNKKSVLKALQAGTLSSGSGSQIDIKERSAMSKKDVEMKRTFVVKNLPDDFTIHKCIEQFRTVGEIEMVNVVFHTLMQKNFDGKTFAFIVFKDIPQMDTLETMCQLISDDVIIEPSKNTKGKPQQRNRSKKIFVEKMSTEFTMDDLVKHFGSFGEVTFTKMFDLQEGNVDRSAIIEFKTNDEAYTASQETLQHLNGKSILVRSLGWTA